MQGTVGARDRTKAPARREAGPAAWSPPFVLPYTTMILKRVQVQNYMNIDDSDPVDTGQVTCLVGKNESGKTAFMKALNKLNPVNGQDGEYDATMEFPRKHLTSYQRDQAKGADPAPVVIATFELESTDHDELPAMFDGAIKSDELTITQRYDNSKRWQFDLDHQKLVANLVAHAKLPEEHAKELSKNATVQELRVALGELEDVPEAATLVEAIDGWEGDADGHFIDALTRWVPEFFYFDDYSIMKGRISVTDLQRKIDAGQLDDADHTFLAFLGLVGAELAQFQSEDNFEQLTAQMEGASNEISDELFKFWSQNDQLAVEFRLSGPDAEALPPLNEGNNLHIRIRNQRHRVTVPFDQRSRGFVWFFSFLVYFSQLEAQPGKKMVLLLDEPGLNLHAKAQEDFLKLINERLAPHYQVIYTTHSPFMVEPDKLDRARTVEDREDKGAKVSADVFMSAADTVFPLQAALGYELAQTLFVAKDNLLVEGPADYLYLTIMSAHLKDLKRTHVDERWTIVPVGGIDKIPTFVALLGAELRVAALIDGKSGGTRKINDLINKHVIEEARVIALANVVEAREADIEDLFEDGWYVKLVKQSGAANIAKSNLGAGQRIIARIEKEAGKYDHYEPARHLLEHQGDLLPDLDDETLGRFEKLFTELNQLLD